MNIYLIKCRYKKEPFFRYYFNINDKDKNAIKDYWIMNEKDYKIIEIKQILENDLQEFKKQHCKETKNKTRSLRLKDNNKFILKYFD